MMGFKSSSDLKFNNFLLSFSILTALALLTFIVLQWLNVPSGHLIDWTIGILSFWWLLVIVTIPWNIHFQAKEVVIDAEKSKKIGITVPDEPVEYVSSWVKRSLIFAISLHILSAAGLYLLASTGVSSVGYIGCGAALLLTILRPAVRAYEYLMKRLNNIQESLKYPREDVVTLRRQVNELIEKVKYLQEHTDPNHQESWAAQHKSYTEAMSKQLENISISLDALYKMNNTEHERLSKEAQQAVSQLTEDGQVLNHVREIIRFFKKA